MENTETVAAAPEAPAAREIIRGRMPVAVVHLIRHGNLKGESNKVLAERFGTTVGKVDDIKKGRNFAYVTDAFKPTAEQKQQGLDWLKRHPDYDAQNVDALVLELDSTPDATPEEAAAFEATRVGARGQSVTTKDGEVANAGGGNRRGRKPKADDTADGAEAGAPAADALLS